MEVHPVHHAPHSVRDFFLQLLMITIGLFIALTLQTGVESLHHRHLVREARESMHREIHLNQQRYAENVLAVEQNRRRVARNIELLKELRAGRHIARSDLAWSWAWNSFADAAWRTARDNAALTYMSADLIGVYTEIYLQQGYVNSMALAILNEEPKSAAPLQIAVEPSALSATDIQSMLLNLAECDIKLATLQDVTKSLDKMYQQAESL